VTNLAWGRVLVGGLVAGLMWTLLSVVLLGISGRDFMAALPGGKGAPSGNLQGFMFAANLVAGIWGTWLYAAIRAQYGSGWKTGVIAGIAWWIIVSQQSAKWFALSDMPLATAVGPAALTLPSIIMSAIAGGWCYERFTMTRRASGIAH
jgi:hypothetical protein